MTKTHVAPKTGDTAAMQAFLASGGEITKVPPLKTGLPKEKSPTVIAQEAVAEERKMAKSVARQAKIAVATDPDKVAKAEQRATEKAAKAAQREADKAAAQLAKDKATAEALALASEKATERANAEAEIAEAVAIATAVTATAQAEFDKIQAEENAKLAALREKYKNIIPPAHASTAKPRSARHGEGFDRYGIALGTKNAQAVVMLERGACMAEISAALGVTFYNLISSLRATGHKIRKDGKVIYLTHMDD